MKKNKNLKVLLPVVILIWGILLFKIVDSFNGDEMPMAKNVISTFKKPTIVKKETFALLSHESDPFLGTMYHKETAKKLNSGKSRKRQEIVWPNVSCQGIISGKTIKSRVYILLLNGQQHLVKKGDTLAQMKVLKGSEKALKLKYKGQTKEFPIM